MLIIFGTLFGIVADIQGIYPYSARFMLGNENLSTALLTFRMSLELVGIIAIIPFIRKIGKRNCTLISSVLMVIGTVIMAVAPSFLPVLLVGLALGGLGVGATWAVLFALIADTIEYQEWRSGVRVEGLVYAVGSFGQRVGIAVGVAVVGWALAVGGYSVELGNNQPSGVITAVKFVLIWMPMALAILMAVIMWRYDLDKTYPQILAD
jgi:GPH family glycoside/pentoside/hexuronide:cation symporter